MMANQLIEQPSATAPPAVLTVSHLSVLPALPCYLSCAACAACRPALFSYSVISVRTFDYIPLVSLYSCDPPLCAS